MQKKLTEHDEVREGSKELCLHDFLWKSLSTKVAYVAQTALSGSLLSSYSTIHSIDNYTN